MYLNINRGYFIVVDAELGERIDGQQDVANVRVDLTLHESIEQLGNNRILEKLKYKLSLRKIGNIIFSHLVVENRN